MRYQEALLTQLLPGLSPPTLPLPSLAGLYIKCSKTCRRIRVRFSSAEAEIHRSDDRKGTRTWVNPVTDMAMALRRPGPLLFLTLNLLAAGLAQLIRPPDSYRKFVSEHVDFPKTRPPSGQSYCDHMMRRLSQKIHMCKLTHTYIHAPASQLRAICTTGGRCNQYNECDSNAAYPLTTCQVRSPPRPPSCVYRGIPQTRRIRVACNRGLPVRFIRVL
ncbi:ribonuclease-like isoform X2 [Chrysemys picta bellii]|uniref:ribonuclease-like isoform X2 n=1 Tax=Chrysemys picta bellii TaxID=8478 RepID=UPI0032B16401